MCGFVTIVTGQGKTVNTAVLREMTARLTHRGPDDLGYAWVDPSSGACRTWTSDLPSGAALSGVLFGFRRLSILDLTEAGHQPMLSDDGSLVLSFNGEIYNFVELKEELESHGVAFRSRCDTEVLLKSYERWGDEALNRFNGMWALTLWDARKKALVVSRDRFGIKPLYHSEVEGTRIFASEIKAILAYPGAFRGFDESNVGDFLTRCLVDNDENTLFRGIRSVPPAVSMEVAGDRTRVRRFWTLQVGRTRERQPEPELVDRFGSLLADSVRLRMRSDVPVGTMLSGGLDSTSITALIHEQRQLAGSGSSGPGMEGLHSFHHTFSACWPGWKSNEEADVDLLCAELDLRSNKVYPTAEAMAALLPEVMYSLEEPFETPTAVLQYLLMREASAHGIKVVLNGHGSDEILAGYPGPFVPPFLASLLVSGHPFQYLREHRAFRATGEWTTREVFEVFRKVVKTSARRRRSLFAGDVGSSEPNRSACAAAAPEGLSPLNSALWSKFTTLILPMWLRMEDRVSMAHSVESRLPFMDYRLIEFAFNLPDDLKLRNGYTKYILRQAMSGRLPNRIAFNRVKQRFATPYPNWFRGAWRPMIEDLLFASSHVQPYLNVAGFRKKLGAYLAGDDQALDSATLWRVLSTEICLRTFSESASSQPV